MVNPRSHRTSTRTFGPVNKEQHNGLHDKDERAAHFGLSRDLSAPGALELIMDLYPDKPQELAHLVAPAPSIWEGGVYLYPSAAATTTAIATPTSPWGQ